MIEKLLHKYWQGESSQEEEKQLRELLQRDDTPEEYWKYREMFAFYETESGKKRQKKQGIFFFLGKTNRRLWQIGISVAAAIVMLVYLNLDQPPQEKTTFSDPEVEFAYEETKKALMLMSQKMNGSKKHTRKIRKVKSLTDVFTIVNKTDNRN
ncbi:MAG: hypothetical protein AAF206_06830 [Bacteroidota bacterium]